MIPALIRPEAAYARVDRLAADLTARLTFRGDAAATARIDFVERVLLFELIPLGPQMSRLEAPVLRCSG